MKPGGKAVIDLEFFHEGSKDESVKCGKQIDYGGEKCHTKLRSCRDLRHRPIYFGVSVLSRTLHGGSLHSNSLLFYLHHFMWMNFIDFIAISSVKIMKVMKPKRRTVRYSDVSFPRTVFIPKGRFSELYLVLWSERLIIRRVIALKILIPKCHCSERFLIRKVFIPNGFYSEWF